MTTCQQERVGCLRHMERSVVTQLGVLVAACSLLGLGCGEDDGYQNRNRPPEPIVVAASITDDGVSIAPRRFGAGPVQLIVTNLTDDARELTLETTEIGGTGGGIEQSTGQINPGTTAQLNAELRQGRYAISVDGAGTTPLRVGSPRPTAQDQLLQP
jgi:hypothetical protein